MTGGAAKMLTVVSSSTRAAKQFEAIHLLFAFESERPFYAGYA